MVTRKVRQAKIGELIESEKIHSQNELVEKLRKFGIEVTQATLSRDLKTLGVVKSRDGYEISTEKETQENGDGLRPILRAFVKSVDASGNIVVLRTGPSNAPAVAVALDRTGWPELLGTVAGEDTLFALVKKPALAGKIAKRIRHLLT